MSLQSAVIAANRFGLGARPGELRTIADDPRGWLLEQLRPETSLPEPLAALPGTGENLLELPLYLIRLKVTERLARGGSAIGSARRPAASGRRPGSGPRPASGDGPGAGPAPRPEEVPDAPPGRLGSGSPATGVGVSGRTPFDRQAGAVQDPEAALRSLIIARNGHAALAHLTAAIASDTPFRERLMRFWSNHFTVSAQDPQVALLPSSFERDVIRPNVTGRFTRMLSDATRHPAMQLYLDNHLNVGARSWYARHPRDFPGGLLPNANDHPGLNENLAREILELHTVGVAGGYGQQDVTEFARVLTGWGIRPLLGDRQERWRMLRNLLRSGDPADALEAAIEAIEVRHADMPWESFFHYDPRAQEPGEFTVMGRRYGQAGEALAQQVLDDLAVHPATARSLAYKLCSHFIADEPPPQAVDRVARAFLESEGDLVETTAALVTSPEAWTADRRKFKRPDEFLISALRGLDVRSPVPPATGRALVELGQPPFRPPGPDGWADDETVWASPDGIWKRIEWVNALTQRVAFAGLDVLQRSQALLGETLDSATRRAIEEAATPAQALTLLLVSPDFLRR